MMNESADGVWEATREAVLRGLNHALSNRVASLIGIARILEQQGSKEDPITNALVGEVARLERLFSLYTLLPAGSPGYLEPIEVPELLTHVMELHGLRGDLSQPEPTVEIDPLIRPIRAQRAAVAHALLSLLGFAARNASPSEPGRIVCGSRESVTYLRFCFPTADEGDAEEADTAAL
jgi:nitrogen-specific signal transduction histidine kinase